jgi:hypothetical protein
LINGRCSTKTWMTMMSRTRTRSTGSTKLGTKKWHVRGLGYSGQKLTMPTSSHLRTNTWHTTTVLVLARRWRQDQSWTKWYVICLSCYIIYLTCYVICLSWVPYQYILNVNFVAGQHPQSLGQRHWALSSKSQGRRHA